jgi:hypothetical protein
MEQGILVANEESRLLDYQALRPEWGINITAQGKATGFGVRVPRAALRSALG